MPQVKIFGLKSKLAPNKSKVSEVIHSTLVSELKLPIDKKFQRFFLFEKDDFYFSPDRSDSYTIIEISMFEGREDNTKRQIIKKLYKKFQSELQITANDLEITIFETPKYNWGIRGEIGDELNLNYNVAV